MAIPVSRNDITGTAMTAARGAADHLQYARTSPVMDADSLQAASVDLVQALAETVYLRSGFGPVGNNVRDFDSEGVENTCAHITEKILEAIEHVYA